MNRPLKSLDAQADVHGMATVLPDNPASQLQFFKTRADEWAIDPAALGLTPLQAAEVQAATLAAGEAWRRAYDARMAARMATQDWAFAARRLREVGGGAIKTIKTYAAAADKPEVLPAASLPIPGRPGPKARTPGERDSAVPRVRTCSARPDSRGGIEVEWTCGIGETMGAGFGMFYRVERSLDGGALALLDVVGSPGAGKRTVRFTDQSVPTGTRMVQYTVTPMRGEARGRPGPTASVQFGGTQAGPGGASVRKAA